MKLLSRRTMLRGSVLGGTAVALGLPQLDAMLNPSGAYAGGETPRPFFGVFYWANGVPWHARHGGEQAAAGVPDVWTPGATGPGYAMSEMLAPLGRHQPTLFSGLQPHTAVPPSPPGQEDGHMRGFMVALTGDRIRPEGFDHPSHTLAPLRPTIDQVLAREPGFYGTAVPRFRSVHVGVSDARFHDYGHWNAISYNGPSSQNLPFMRPDQLYSLLFSVPPDADELRARASLLDAVREDASSLRMRLGSGDRLRLDEHLEHVREIERRMLLATGAACTPPAPPTDGDLMGRANEMAELLAVALRCELTGIFTFMLTSPASTHVFSNVGVPDGLHKVCHDGLWEQVRRVTHHQMDCFATVMDRLAEVTDATGASLLDRGLVLGVTEYGEGWKHSTNELPAIVIGGANGRMARGVHVREEGGNFARVHLTALQALGLPLTTWGWNGGETDRPFTELLPA